MRTPVQRSAAARSPVSGPGAQAGIVPGGPAAGNREPAAGYRDPGTIAVARGLARREPDGSVVFDLGPSPAPPEPSPPPRQEAPAGWYTVAGSGETVQRQEAAGAAGAPAPSPGGEPGMASITASAPSPATGPASSAAPAGPPASGAASPPLDELARRLFEPLTARLKAELRLDRERAGLLTDLRQ